MISSVLRKLPDYAEYPVPRRTSLLLPTVSSSELTDEQGSGPCAALAKSPDWDKLADEDDLKSILAGLVQRGKFNSNCQIRDHCNGRVVIQKNFWHRSGPETDPSTVGCDVWATNYQTQTNEFGQLYHFSTTYDSMDPGWEHRPSTCLLSESHISLINRWKHTCETEHESCRKTPYNQPLPTRILELLNPSDEMKGLRLVETRGKSHGTYACLSYCWGDPGAQDGQTTRSNLDRQLDGIPLCDLPSTVVDAIKLCYELGLRYLWVDRLCILQDDQRDWLQEASKMCEVYSRSALTVSVPICKASSQSFLAERHKGFREQDQFAIVTHGEGSLVNSRAWVSSKPLSQKNGPWYLQYQWDETRGKVGENRWLGRGWTFQEWILSPRVLHIDSMTLWDCFDGYANELNCRQMGAAILLRSPAEFGKGMSWDSIVQHYSSRELTREEDRLPALAGLAARYAQATGHTYLAGMWREDLPRSLLWKRSSQVPDSHAAPWCPNQHAPSWSWASLNRAVDSSSDPSDAFTACASILSTFCQYNPPGSFSAVEKAWIDIRGRVSIVRAYTSPTPNKNNSSESVSGPETGSETRIDWLPIKTGNQRWVANLDRGEDEDLDDMIAKANVYLLRLGSSEYLPPRALVLECLQQVNSEPCFRRLGTAYFITEEDDFDEDFAAFVETRVIRLV